MVGLQQNVLKRKKAWINIRLILKDIKRGRPQGAGFKRVEQGGFINIGCPRDVDQHAFRAKSRKHVPSDDMTGFGRCSQGHEQEVGMAGKVDRIFEVGPFRCGVPRCKVGIGDVHVESGKALADFVADAPQTQNTDPFSMHPVLEIVQAVIGPFAASDPVFRSDHSARLNKHHGNTQVSDILCQHIRRVGHPDVVFAGGLQVHLVESDSVDGDDFQIGQCFNQVAVGSDLSPCCDAADRCGMLRNKCILVFSLENLPHREAGLELFIVPYRVGAQLQYLDFVHFCPLFSRNDLQNVIDNIYRFGSDCRDDREEKLAQGTKLFDLSGKTALITGSSQGIGHALARGLSQAGAAIVMNGRNEEKLAKAAEGLRGEGATVHELLFDATDHALTVNRIDGFEESTGPIDILVNNAGMQHRTPLENFEPAMFAKLLSTNITTVFNVGQSVARHMIKRGAGKIINIASVQTAMARPGIAPYTATKGAVGNLTKGMATDWAKHGLQINAIAPGYFDTPLNAALVADPEFSAWLEKRTPAGRWGEIEELVGACVFLSSAASSFVNGHTLYVDGGITACL